MACAIRQSCFYLQKEDPMNWPKDSNPNSASLPDSILGKLSKFESAISGLTHTIEQTRHNFENALDLSVKSKEELRHIKESVMPYVTTARQASQKAVSRVRSNPRPVALFAGCVFGCLLLASLLRNRNNTPSTAM
jgi:sensor c-di-GMP phosphodiesterase-like protein